MVTLTCFTTTVGLIAAVSTFFAEEFTVLSYKQYVTLICVVSFLLANLGLNQIIQITLPLLLFVYPIAIVVVMLTILNKFVSLSKLGMRCTAAAAAWYRPSTSLISSSMSGRQDLIQGLPLGDSGLGWLAPALVCMALSLVLPGKITGDSALASEE